MAQSALYTHRLFLAQPREVFPRFRSRRRTGHALASRALVWSRDSLGAGCYRPGYRAFGSRGNPRGRNVNGIPAAVIYGLKP